MADIVNLRLARKQKARQEQHRVADENRAIHGRTKAERQLQARRAERADAVLDGHRRASRDTGAPDIGVPETGLVEPGS